jgi:hypothetical protein
MSRRPDSLESLAQNSTRFLKKEIRPPCGA